MISTYALVYYFLLAKLHLIDYFLLGKKEKQAQERGDEGTLAMGQGSGAGNTIDIVAHGWGFLQTAAMTGIHLDFLNYNFD